MGCPGESSALCVCVQVVMLSSVSDLLTYIDEQQLTPELGGTLEYCHSEWVIFRTVSAGWPWALSQLGLPGEGFQTGSGHWGAESDPQSHCTSCVDLPRRQGVLGFDGLAGELDD